MDNDRKFDETHLPSIKRFYNKLNNEQVSRMQYNQALTVWNSSQRQFICNYMDVYLKIEIFCDN